MSLVRHPLDPPLVVIAGSGRTRLYVVVFSVGTLGAAMTLRSNGRTIWRNPQISLSHVTSLQNACNNAHQVEDELENERYLSDERYLSFERS